MSYTIVDVRIFRKTCSVSLYQGEKQAFGHAGISLLAAAQSFYSTLTLVSLYST